MPSERVPRKEGAATPQLCRALGPGWGPAVVSSQGSCWGVWLGVHQGVWLGLYQGVWLGVHQGVWLRPIRGSVHQGVWLGAHQRVWLGVHWGFQLDQASFAELVLWLALFKLLDKGQNLRP